MNLKAFDALDYSLCIASAAADGKRSGCIVNSLTQVTSSAPARFALSMNRDNATTLTVQKSGFLSVTVLAKTCPRSVINDFGYKSGRAIDKFAGYDTLTDANGSPYIKDNMAARIALRVLQAVEVGSHLLFICEVTDAEVWQSGRAMTVADFRDEGSAAPTAAPIYREVGEHEGWKCTVCGYIVYKDELPDDYKCPICKAPRAKFEKL